MEKTNGFFKTFKYMGLLFFIVFCLLGTVGVESGGDNISPAASDNGRSPDIKVPRGKTASTDEFIDDLPSWWYTIDVLPLEAGSSITASNSSFEVTLGSDKYVILDDFTTHGVWVHVKDLGGSDNSFSFTLTSVVPEGWTAPGESSALPLPGNEGDLGLVLPGVDHAYSGKREAAFTYKVSSEEYVETVSLTFTLVFFPQVTTAGYTEGDATLEGTITDATTGSPISDAEVTLWLGYSIQILPYDMVEATDSAGFYRLSCWDVDVLNDYYSPYLTGPGYMLVVQKAGYETYVHDEFVKPEHGSPITFNASLTPLENQVDFDLQWGTPLSSPGVWGIAVTDAWDRFAAAMGKHPDAGDPETLPTSIPFLDNEGNILWSKSLDDQSWAIDVTSDGSYIACTTHASTNNYCYLWDSAGNEVWKKTITSQSTVIKFSPDNNYIATGPSEGGKSFVLYNALTGAEEWTYDTGRLRVRQTAFTSDGQYVLLGPPLHLFTRGGQLVWRRNEDVGLPYIICPSTDKSRIFIPTKGDITSMYDGDGNLLWRKEHRVTTYGGMSADGSVVVVLSHNGNLYCYNGEGELQWYRLVPGTGGSGGAGHDGLDITPDGQYIAVGGGNYNTILYDSKGNVLWRHTGSASIDISEHPYWHSVMNVKISEDGKKIVSGYGYSDPRLCYFTFTSTLLYVEPLGSCGGNTPCYSTIQAAIDAASSGKTIKIAGGSYDEALTLSSSKDLTLQGGWDSTFTSQSSNTTVNSLTISNGSIEVDKVILQ